MIGWNLMVPFNRSNTNSRVGALTFSITATSDCLSGLKSNAVVTPKSSKNPPVSSVPGWKTRGASMVLICSMTRSPPARRGDPPAKPAATVIAIVTSSDSVEAKMCSLRYLQFERLFPSRVPE